MRIDEILEAASVIPVLEVADLSAAAPLAKALADGGLKVIELTLRTDCALEALGVMKETAPSLIVGMGTVRTGLDVEKSVAGGADFLVSPGASRELLTSMAGASVPSLPGVATASEAMTAFDHGFRAMKFFPAEPAGGVPYLKSIAGPMPDIIFCPTGGITPETAPNYLKLPNVACIGGSWIAPKALISRGDWATITKNAREAHMLASNL